MNAPDLSALTGVAGGTARAAEVEPPAFLRREQPAIFGWFSSGRLVILKGGEAISLDRDDLADLRRFLGDFEG